MPRRRYAGPSSFISSKEVSIFNQYIECNVKLFLFASKFTKAGDVMRIFLPQLTCGEELAEELSILLLI